MKFIDLKRGEVFKAYEPYEKNEEYYMAVYDNTMREIAVRLKDGRTIQFNNLSDVTKVDVNVLELVEEADKEGDT